MSTAKLNWALDSNGIRFQLHDAADRVLDINRWGLHTVHVGERVGSIAPLLGLLEDAALTIHDDHSVSVTHAQLATFDEAQVQQLGLPQAAPYRLSIRGQGILTSPRFCFRYQLIGHDGRPVL